MEPAIDAEDRRVRAGTGRRARRGSRSSTPARLLRYAFIAVVFFVLSYALSQASYRLERELGIGER